MSEVQNTLRSHGVQLEAAPLTHMPLVCVWGRVDDGITFRGANLAWENLEETLRILDLGDVVTGFGLLQYEADGRVHTDIALHVREDEQEALMARGPDLLKNVLKTLRDLNHDFAHQLDCILDPKDLPGLRLYVRDSPMAEHSRMNPARKCQHIFLGRDAARALEIDDGGKYFCAR
jgi:hypothetical protein